MPFTKQFIEDLHKAFGPYVIEAVESESGIAGRILDDNVETGVNYKEILTAISLDELKKKAEKIALQNKVYRDFRSGRCYEDDETKRKKTWMPRCLEIKRLWMHSLAIAFRTFRAARNSRPPFAGESSMNSG